MKILAIAFFDPASVVLSHRDLMRAAGHDFRLACVRAYTERQLQADWLLERAAAINGIWDVRPHVIGDHEELREFARQADVIQLHPGIGTGANDWASGTNRVDPKLEAMVSLIRLGFAKPGAADADPDAFHTSRVVAYFHGSVSTWEYRDSYRRFYEGIGCTLAASTIDYAAELDAHYIPPFIDVGDQRAPIRGVHDPMLIAHTPTDTIACQTEEFVNLTRKLGVLTRLNHQWIPHDQVMELKTRCNAGFDHMRGAFSVNTLENAALGLVPLVGLKRVYLERLRKERIGAVDGMPSVWDAPPMCFWSRKDGYVGIETFTDLGHALQGLDASPLLHQSVQRYAREWYEKFYSSSPITKRLLDFYARIA